MKAIMEAAQQNLLRSSPINRNFVPKMRVAAASTTVDDGVLRPATPCPQRFMLRQTMLPRRRSGYYRSHLT